MRHFSVVLLLLNLTGSLGFMEQKQQFEVAKAFYDSIVQFQMTPANDHGRRLQAECMAACPEMATMAQSMSNIQDIDMDKVCEVMSCIMSSKDCESMMDQMAGASEGASVMQNPMSMMTCVCGCDDFKSAFKTTMANLVENMASSDPMAGMMKAMCPVLLALPKCSSKECTTLSDALSKDQMVSAMGCSCACPEVAKMAEEASKGEEVTELSCPVVNCLTGADSCAKVVKDPTTKKMIDAANCDAGSTSFAKSATVSLLGLVGITMAM